MNKFWVWGCASFISLFLLSLVLVQVDFEQSWNMVRHASIFLIGLALLCLFFEGVMTALRLWIFAGRRPHVFSALQANAWYVLLLVLLPARLGEVAAIVIFQKHLGQKYGAAAASIIMQRLYDVIILGLVFLIALLGLGNVLDTQLMAIVALGFVMLCGVVLVKIEIFLTALAIIFNKIRTPFFRPLRRLVLQARGYSRHRFHDKNMLPAFILTVGKWIGNLGALTLLFMALGLDLNSFEKITTAAAYNFLAIIPLQTVGGIGVGEAGLALLLIGMGLGTSLAAGASLIIRLVVLVFPFIFFAVIWFAGFVRGVRSA